ncbi:hypothetical protein ATB54_07605 [Xanthomonas translucens]|nr:hypothetical protein ATB54_07605 [Xanthomonas translucens]
MKGGELNTTKPVKAAFGAKNRKRLIDLYFEGRGGSTIEASSAWQHVYGLLLWIDQTTGLAHCYESDKSQPGKNWYARTLAFHDWLSASLAVVPGDLHSYMDWLFLHATDDLTAAVLRDAGKISAAAKRQRSPYDGRGFPEPGEDPELVAIIEEVLGEKLGPKPSIEQWKELVRRIRSHLALENKRKNLLGEGFEDVIAQVVSRSVGHQSLKIHTRSPLQDLPGFNNTRHGEKLNKVDVAIIRPERRILVTAKWSVRADRERQFVSDYNDYVYAESSSKPWEYVFVTNEFDPARLRRACDQLAGNSRMFSHVVHINTDGLKATYGSAPEPTMRQVLDHIDQGRLISLEKWLEHLQM